MASTRVLTHVTMSTQHMYRHIPHTHKEKILLSEIIVFKKPVVAVYALLGRWRQVV